MNNILLPLIVLIILAVVWASSLNNPRTRLAVVVGILIMVLILCWLQLSNENMRNQNQNQNKKQVEHFTGASGYAPLGYKLRVENGDPKVATGQKVGCDGYNYMDINSQISPLGTYDGIVLPNHLATAPLMKNVFINSPVGDDIQLTQDPASKYFPSIDGTKEGDKHLFMLANNVVDWSCCPSPYGTDSSRGCVCLSPEQLELFKTRGTNKRGMVEYPDI